MVRISNTLPDYLDVEQISGFTYGSSLPQFYEESKDILEIKKNKPPSKLNSYNQIRKNSRYLWKIILIQVMVLLGLFYKFYIFPNIITNFNDIQNRTFNFKENISRYTKSDIMYRVHRLFVVLTLANNFNYIQWTLQKTDKNGCNDCIQKRNDYAQYRTGAYIIQSLTSPAYTRPSFGIITYITTILEQYIEYSPHPVISDFEHYNSYWPLKSNTGQIAIRLSDKIVIKYIAIYYPNHNNLINKIAAPRDLELWGQPVNVSCLKDICNPILLTSFKFNRYGTDIQIFSVYYSKPVSAIIIKIIDNWGSKQLTNVYKIKIYS